MDNSQQKRQNGNEEVGINEKQKQMIQNMQEGKEIILLNFLIF